jgi:hypothetical protein
MKSFSLFLLLVLVIFSQAKAQIVFEHEYDSASTANNTNQLYMIDLEVDGEKYVRVTRDSANRYITLYNLNHSLYKQISCNSFPLYYSATPFDTIWQYNFEALYISQHLFNTDNYIEFMFYTGTSSKFYTGIYDEMGNVLFAADSAGPFVRPNVPQVHRPIYNTSAGTKMILSFQNGKARVYNLPGILTSAMEQANNNLMDNSVLYDPYPNPAREYTEVTYELPPGAKTGTIVLYDLQGNEVKQLMVDNTFRHLRLSTTDLAAGIYYYSLQTATSSTGGRKVVVIR